MGCESLTPAMCCGDTCGFSLRGRLGAGGEGLQSPGPCLLGLESALSLGGAALASPSLVLIQSRPATPFSGYIPFPFRIFEEVKATLS